MTLAAAFAAWGALQIELANDGLGAVWWLNQGDAATSAAFLGTLLGSLITMATLVISITMVVLTLAAGNLGPRLIRSFMADRQTQAVLGLFIGTIVYLLLVLRLIDGAATKASIPHFAVTAGAFLALLCVLTLLFFVHHLGRSIVADHVVSRVGRDVDAAIRADLRPPDQADEDAPEPPDAPAVVRLAMSGYVQAIDFEQLAEKAAERGLTVRLTFRPGHHLIRDRAHALVWPASGLDEAISAAVATAVVVGHERTPAQDIEFGLRQLVEIAVRALSPGINDPFTAIAVLDRLTASLALIMQRGDSQGVWRDATGAVRLVAPKATFGGAADVAFNQIRQAGEAKPDILMQMLTNIAQLAERPRTADQARILARHADLVMGAARRRIEEPYDLSAVEGRYEEVREQVQRRGDENASTQ